MPRFRRLQTDHIDLYYAHRDCPDDQTPLADSLAAFDALIKAGKVRYIGISNLSPAHVEEWVSIAHREGFHLLIALQPHFYLARRRSYEPELRYLAEQHDLAVFPYFALASGFLTGNTGPRTTSQTSDRHQRGRPERAGLK